MKCFLGVDVGSVSTKFVLINEKNEVLFWDYWRTEGKPVEALKLGLEKLRKWVQSQNLNLEICGVATTGSARYLAGAILGADLIKNEVTAHAKGVSHFVPEARTVIEIGGQDSKIIILENGLVVDFALNLLCSAGTGAFLDAQAFRLGVPVEKFGELALKSKNPTHIASRCLTEDNYLLTPEGVKSIRDIKEGDFVLSEGNFKKVLKKYERTYSGTLYKITRRYASSQPLIVTEEHPILAIKPQFCPFKKYKYICREDCDKKHIRPRCQLNFYKNYSPQWIPANKLEVFDLIVTPKHNTLAQINSPSVMIPLDQSFFSAKKAKFFHISEVDEDFQKNLMRLCGYYLAEGSTYVSKKGNYEVQFSLNEKEKEIVEDINNSMRSIFKTASGVVYQGKYTGKGLQLKFWSKAAHFFFKQFGQSAPNKKIPGWVFDLPKEYLLELIKGFWRGDGGQNCRDHLTFDTSSRHLWEGLAVIFEKCGYIPSKMKNYENKIGQAMSEIKWRNCKIVRKYPLFRLELGGKQMQRLFSELGVTATEKIKKFWEKRKRTYQLAYERENYILYPIRKIEKMKVKNVKVYNLEVEETESYLVNGFLCHNCSVFAESDMIHKQQIGHKLEDIVAGLCLGLARNYLASVGKGKKILPPIVFLGGVSENVGMRWAFQKLLNQEILVPPYNKVMGALGAALLVKENPPQKTKFRGFEISGENIECSSFQCHGCPNECEVIEVKIGNKVVARFGDRCGKWSNIVSE